MLTLGFSPASSVSLPDALNATSLVYPNDLMLFAGGTTGVELGLEFVWSKRTRCADNDDAGPRRPRAPFTLNCDIGALADNLQHRTMVGVVAAVNHALGPVDTGGKLAGDLKKGVERKRLIRLVAPRAERARMVMMMLVPAVGVMARRSVIHLSMAILCYQAARFFPQNLP
ncbi:hypothetical protein [Ensifer sesbaniae]|uniref:hypothetical protein n=1 Tax=Ensifer sesbaniae TaxID=1214071 RepID=UPI003D80017A